jgi:allantoin racemase
MSSKIMLVVPVTGKDLYRERLEYLRGLGMDVSVTVIEEGAPSIESFYDAAMSVPDTLKRIEEAEKKGYEAVVIDCWCDPGLEAAREKVDIPVIGPGQASMLTAMALGGRFSVLGVTKNVVSHYWHNIHAYGLGDRVASVRIVDVPVLELHKHRKKVLRHLVEESVKAIEEDGAGVLIIGCTGLVFLKNDLERKLRDRGYEVPIIDSILAALNFAQMLVRSGLKQSRVEYMKPPTKTISSSC